MSFKPKINKVKSASRRQDWDLTVEASVGTCLPSKAGMKPWLCQGAMRPEGKIAVTRDVVTQLRSGKYGWRKNEPRLTARRSRSLVACMDGAPLTENKNPEGNTPSSATWATVIPLGPSRRIPTQVGEGGSWEGHFNKGNHDRGLGPPTTVKLCSPFTEKGYFKVH